MQLRTPKRYTAKGSRRPLLNLKWLWLYLITPVIVVIAALVWDYRGQLGDVVGKWSDRNISIGKSTTPTPVPTPVDPNEFARALNAGRVDRAVDILENLSNTAPNQPGFPALAAQLLVFRANGTSQENLRRATALGQRAITANPEAPDGWISEAMVLDWDKKPQVALGYALRARDLSPKDPMVLTILAEIYHDLGKDEQASKLLDSAITAAKAGDSVNLAALAHAYYVRAMMFDAANDSKSAVDAMEQARRVAASDPTMTVPLGYISQWLGAYYLSQSQADKASTVLNEGVKRDQDDPILQWQLGMVYINTGDPNKARSYFETCRNLDPLQPKCLKRLAQLFYSEQNYTQVVDIIQKVIDQNLKDPKDYYMSGLGYIGLNQCDKAIPALNTGLQYIDPADASMRADYEELLRSCGVSVAVPTAIGTEESGQTTPVPPK